MITTYIEYHHRCFRLGSYFMAAVLAAVSYSKGKFSPCLAGSVRRVMAPGGSTFHLEPGTITGLFPQPTRHPCPRPPSGTLIEVQNWSRRNILRVHILPPRGVFPDPLEACLHQCFLQWRILLTPTPLYPWLPPGEPTRNPVLENTKGPLHPGG